ncbi:MAG: hypothetical protein AAGJ52_14750, partial [Pseudomonadota bacterium]
MRTINCMLWILTEISQGKDGASSATSQVAVMKQGGFQSIATPARDTVIADGEQIIIYTIEADGWEFVPWHGTQRAPNGQQSAYPDTPLLMVKNDQVKVVSWS